MCAPLVSDPFRCHRGWGISSPSGRMKTRGSEVWAPLICLLLIAKINPTKIPYKTIQKQNKGSSNYTSQKLFNDLKTRIR